jgi:predicted RecB family nuclease
LGERKPVHQYELQALALRTKKIYTTELIEPPHNDIELFVGFESLPEEKFHYLMGVYVSSSSSQQYFPFWSNTKQDEKQSWLSFLQIIDCYPDAPLFHYGNYENKVIKELGGRYETDVDNVLGRLCNLNSYIFGRIYFPTYTNKLKDICTYLGHTWTDENANGLNSIVLPSAYDEIQDPSIRDDLILYNQEDCINLKKLKNTIGTICSHDSNMPNVMDINVSDQLLNSTGSRIVKDFDDILKSAHGAYE